MNIKELLEQNESVSTADLVMNDTTVELGEKLIGAAQEFMEEHAYLFDNGIGERMIGASLARMLMTAPGEHVANEFNAVISLFNVARTADPSGQQH